MRPALVVGLALAAGAATGCMSIYERAVEDANRDGKPLVIEFYADWCGPCHRFESGVLSRLDVQTALAQVTFRRFDFDSKAGRREARRLGVRAIPQFLAIGGDGNVVGGLRGAVSAEQFLAFLDWTRQQRPRQ